MTEPTEPDFEQASEIADALRESAWVAPSDAALYNLARCYLTLRQREARREALEKRRDAWLKEKPWRRDAGHEERELWLQFQEDGTWSVSLYYCNRDNRGEKHDGHDEGIAADPLDALEEALNKLEKR